MALVKIQFHTDVYGRIASVSSYLYTLDRQIYFTRTAGRALKTTVYLSKFKGKYILKGMPVTIDLDKKALKITFPGSPPAKLIPVGRFEFKVENMKGYLVRFRLDSAGKVKDFLYMNPVGAATGKRIK